MAEDKDQQEGAAKRSKKAANAESPLARASASHAALARKYRPKLFSELIGQDAMVQTLKNAFASGRIAQAYMLAGVRGVGKTTTARLGTPTRKAVRNPGNRRFSRNRHQLQPAPSTSRDQKIQPTASQYRIISLADPTALCGSSCRSRICASTEYVLWSDKSKPTSELQNIASIVEAGLQGFAADSF